MVPHDWLYSVRFALQFHDKIQNGFTVRPPVDIISEKKQRIFLRQSELFSDQVAKTLYTTMNITHYISFSVTH
jgi:hypothetical protein